MQVFSRDACSFGGEIAFVGRENVKNIQKNKNKSHYCLGEGGGGDFPPPKALKRKKKKVPGP